MASRFEELTKQPEAKWIKIYNQGDKFDHKAHNILVSPRNVKDFDHFVDRRVLQEDTSSKANAVISM